MQVHTKQIGETYCCYATILGYDYSFTSTSLHGAQSQMNTVLQSKNIFNATFNEVEIIERSNVEKYNGGMTKAQEIMNQNI